MHTIFYPFIVIIVIFQMILPVKGKIYYYTPQAHAFIRFDKSEIKENQNVFFFPCLAPQCTSCTAH